MKTPAQRTALAHPCRLAGETVHPRFASWIVPDRVSPVWHASVLSLRGDDRKLLHEAALEALEGVGDATLGEWVEITARGVHVRRRLSRSEAERVDPVRDIRGTREVEARLAKVRRYLPPAWKEVSL